MKFRTIYLLFNVVISVSFLFIFILPLALLGGDYALEFWKRSWYLALLFLALLGILNGFFVWNGKLFSLFEREDWNGLSAWLVERIFVKRRYGRLHVRYLVDTYFILGDVDGFARLEEELRARKPGLLRKTAVLFGFARILRGQAAEAEAFLKPWLGQRDIESWEWLRFGYAFALVLQRRAAEARPQLLEGASSRDPVLALLAAWLIDSLILPQAGGADAEAGAAVDSVRKELRKRFPGSGLEREIERARGEFQVVVLTKPIAEARKWLASEGS